MKQHRRTTRPTPEVAPITVSLEQLERMLRTTTVRVPSDATVVRETSRALQAMSSGCDFATITCVSGPDGVQITGGRDALEVARVLRARASWRGDHFWAGELGRRLRFHVVRSTAVPQRRRRTSFARLATRGLQLAAS